MTPYLYARQNPHAPRRTNGVRFWGYPLRPHVPRLIGIHTTESIFDQIGRDTGAENVAAYQARTDRPSSYHRIVDRDSTVVCLPDEAVAFGISGLNSPTLQVSLAMRAADWSNAQKARDAAPTLERAAQVVAEWCRDYAIPVRRLTRAQALRGDLGLIAHGDADPDRRSDPGAAFPWAAFLARVQQLVTPTRVPPTISEDIVATKAELADLLDERVRLIIGKDDAEGGDDNPTHISQRDIFRLLQKVDRDMSVVQARLDAIEAARGEEV